MEMWRYFDVTHARHGLMNPISPARVVELGEVLRLEPSTRVLDIACGHAEMLLLWHEQFGITGVGVDASPYHHARACERKAERAPDADLDLRHDDGALFTTQERFDVVTCVGASWIWSGHAGTLRALAGFARPGGVIVTGEPYWKAEPTEAYLEVDQLTRDTFHDLAGCREVALSQGLELIWMAGSSLEEWDRYEMLQAAAMDAFACAHPDDPDLAELRARRRRSDESYLACGRDCLGFALWAFRAPG